MRSIRMIGFSKCNLNRINGITLFLTNETNLLSTNLTYIYGIKKIRAKIKTLVRISIAVVGGNHSGYALLKASTSYIQ